MKVHMDGALRDRVDALTDLNQLRTHFIGVGGSGMCGAAAMLLQLGARVTGSDHVAFEGMGPLVEAGARIAVGHRETHLDPGVDLAVVSAAIPETNPELTFARKHQIPVLKYAELVGILMQLHAQGVAIAGTHGKSTTTALCTHLCGRAGLIPSFLVGARSRQLGGSSHVGDGRLFIVEACEFNRSFLQLFPQSAAVLNIEPDHLDCYRDLDAIVEAFTAFARQVAPEGLIVCNGEDPLARRAVADAAADVETFGFSEPADWRAEELACDQGCYEFRVWYRGLPFLQSRLSIPGRHNVSNALAAIALAHHQGVDAAAMTAALPAFEGVQRRMTCRGRGHGVTIVDDYAHHPTEVRVTIEAARRHYEPRRMWVVFQPHQNARTRHFLDQFADSFELADEVVVPDVYGARENDEHGAHWCGSAELVSRMCRRGVRATYLSTLSAAAEHVIRHALDGDLVVTMGAGDVWKVADELVARFCGPNGT